MVRDRRNRPGVRPGRLGATALTIAEFRAGKHLTDAFGVTIKGCYARYVKSQALLHLSFVKGKM